MAKSENVREVVRRACEKSKNTHRPKNAGPLTVTMELRHLAEAVGEAKAKELAGDQTGYVAVCPSKVLQAIGKPEPAKPPAK